MPRNSLPQQEGLDQRTFAGLEIGQHAQLFHSARRQVLRLVHHQQRALALTRGRGEKILQILQQCGFGQAFVLQAERRGHATQGVLRIQLGRHQLRRHQIVGLELTEQVTYQRGLAGTDLAGDDDESLAQRQAVIQVGHRPLVALGAEEKSRIGIELERFGAKAVIVFVHGQSVV